MEKSKYYNVPWERLSRETIHQNPWWKLEYDKVRRPDGTEGEYFVVNTNSAAYVVPYQDGKILLIEQYRYPTDEVMIEIPAGGSKDGQNIEAAARAELQEETGFVAGKIKHLGYFAHHSGVSSENAHVFLATDLTETEKKPDCSEFIRHFWKSVEEVYAMVDDNIIRDGGTIASLAMARKHLLGGGR